MQYREAKRQNEAVANEARGAFAVAQDRTKRLAPTGKRARALYQFGNQTDDNPANFNTAREGQRRVEVTKEQANIIPLVGNSHIAPRL